MNFQVIMLLCNLTMPSSQCDIASANSFIVTVSRNEITCIHDAEEMAARTALTDGVYLKAICRKTK